MEKLVKDVNFEQFKWDGVDVKLEDENIGEIQSLDERVKSLKLALRDSGKANLTKKSIDDLLKEIEDLKQAK